MKNGIRRIIINLCIGVVGLLILILVWQPWRKYDLIDKINIEKDIYIEILTDRSWEVARPVYGRIRKRDIFEHTHYIGSISPEVDFKGLEFDILISKNGNLIALYEKQTSQKILLIYERTTAKVWTGYTGDTAIELFDKLNEEFPEKQLVRSDLTNAGEI